MKIPNLLAAFILMVLLSRLALATDEHIFTGIAVTSEQIGTFQDKFQIWSTTVKRAQEADEDLPRHIFIISVIDPTRKIGPFPNNTEFSIPLRHLKDGSYSTTYYRDPVPKPGY